MVAALYGVGLRAGDRYFCPSSPAWGHGLWHGTVAPLALGIAVGSYSGKFRRRPHRRRAAAFGITNLAAAPTVYRMLRESGAAVGRRLSAGEAVVHRRADGRRTWEFVERAFGVAPCSMYGSTEVGVIIVNYPGFDGYRSRPGALGKAGARMGRRGGRRRRAATAAGTARRDRRAPARRVVPRQGPRLRRRRRLLLPRRPVRRRDHLGGLDDERAGDRAGPARPSRRARGGGDRRPRRAARSDPQGLRRGAGHDGEDFAGSCRSS